MSPWDLLTPPQRHALALDCYRLAGSALLIWWRNKTGDFQPVFMPLPRRLAA